VLGVLHLGVALLALASGLVVCLSRKGTTWHTRWGWTYVIAMVAVNLTALSIYSLLGRFGPFHAAAIFSLLTIVLGVVPALRRANRFWLLRHAYWMAGSYVGLWAAAVAETTTRTDLLPFWWMTALASLAVFVVGISATLRGVPRAIAGLKRRRS
jgi:uncharacterized membrane protein